MKKLIIAAAILLSMDANAQRVQPRFDFRFGVGTSFLSTGDIATTMLENELNYFINNFLATSISIGYGRSNEGVFETASFFQGNLNIYLSPFKNNKRNDFRIGTGLSYINVSDAYLVSADYSNGVVIDEDYKFDKVNSIGMSIILENTYSIREKFLVGLKLFTQPYENGDMNSGVLVKLGLKI